MSLQIYSDGILFDESQQYTMQFQPASFSVCQLSMSPSMVYTSSMLTVNLKPTFAIEKDGKLVIQIPKKWSTDPRSIVSFRSILDTSIALSCTKGSLYPTENTPTCISSTSDSGIPQITVTGFSLTQPLLQQFSFNILNIISPPSTEASGIFYIKSYTSNNLELEECEFGAKVTVNTAKTITSASLYFNARVNQLSVVTLSFDTASPVGLKGYSALITIPSTTTISSNPTITGLGICSFSSGNQRTPIVENNNQLRMAAGTVFNGPANPGTNCRLFLTRLQAPPSTKPTPISGSIQIFSNGYLVDEIFSSLKITANKGLFASASLSSIISTINAETQYIFQITPTNKLLSTGWIKIIFPSTIKVGGGTCAGLLLSGTAGSINPNPYCVVTSGTQDTVSITNIFIEDFKSDGVSVIQITLGKVTNPSTPDPTSSFMIETYYDDSPYIVDDSSSQNLIMTPEAGLITGVSVVSSSYATLKEQVTYTISLIATNGIIAGGYIEVILPPEIFGSNSQCKYQGSTLPCTYDLSARKYVLVNLPVNLPTGTKINLQLQGVTNPSIVKSYESFQISTHMSTGYRIDQILTGVQITMTTPSDFQSLIISQSDSTNGAVNDISFKITFAATHSDSNHKIIIIFPSQLTLPTDIVCTTQGIGNSPNLLQSIVPCQKDGDSQVMVSLSFNTGVTSLIRDNIIIITVENVQNYKIKKQTDSFQISSTTGIDTQVIHRSTTLTLTNLNLGQIVTMKGTPALNFLEEVTTWTIQFTMINLIPPNGLVRVIFPSGFTLNHIWQSIITSKKNISPVNPQQLISGLIIEFNGIFDSKDIEFSISNIKNPSQDNSNFIILHTFDSEGNRIDTGDQIVKFKLDCTLPCKTCQVDSITSCLSCYSNPVLVNSQIIFMNQTQKCVSNCPAGMYQKQVSCVTCTLPCTECTSELTTSCTSCQTSPMHYLNIETSTCSTTCASEYYGDSTTAPYSCRQCQSPCRTCENRDTCIQCLSSYFTYNGMCLLICPPSITIQNTNLKICEACVGCPTCVTATNICTSCNLGFYLTVQNTCISDCKAINLYKNDILGTCTGCQGSCLTCEISSNNCTSCIQGQGKDILLEGTGQCIPTCHDMYFVSQQICIKCQSPCQTCTLTKSTCLSCILEYFLQGNQCVNGQSCQSETYSDQPSSTCKTCVPPCKTCESKFVCLSCVMGHYYLNKNCFTNCPAPLYVIDSDRATCERCDIGCESCLEKKNLCTSCGSPYLLTISLNLCSLTCPQSFYKKENDCVQCETPCSSCDTSYSDCLTCIDEFSLHNGLCTINCPDLFYADLNQCLQCQEPCLQCTSPQHCITCSDHLKFIFDYNCLAQCPQTTIAVGKQCEKCSSNCVTCTSQSECSQCQGEYILINGECLKDCPSGFENVYNNCQKPPVVEKTLDRFIPFPFLIAMFVFGFTVLISKFQSPTTFIAGALVGFGCLLEFGSWVTLLCLQIYFQSESVTMPLLTYLTVIGLVLNYINNIVFIILNGKYIEQDMYFIQWKQCKTINNCTYLALKILGILTSFKVSRTLYSRYYGFSFFKLKISDIKNLRFYNILTGVSIIISSLPIIVSSALTVYFNPDRNQLMISSLDTLIFTILIMLLMICEIQKPSDFFQDDLNISRKYSIKENQILSFEVENFSENAHQNRKQGDTIDEKEFNGKQSNILQQQNFVNENDQTKTHDQIQIQMTRNSERQQISPKRNLKQLIIHESIIRDFLQESERQQTPPPKIPPNQIQQNQQNEQSQTKNQIQKKQKNEESQINILQSIEQDDAISQYYVGKLALRNNLTIEDPEKDVVISSQQLKNVKKQKKKALLDDNDDTISQMELKKKQFNSSRKQFNINKKEFDKNLQQNQNESIAYLNSSLQQRNVEYVESSNNISDVEGQVDYNQMYESPSKFNNLNQRYDIEQYEKNLNSIEKFFSPQNADQSKNFFSPTIETNVDQQNYFSKSPSVVKGVKVLQKLETKQSNSQFPLQRDVSPQISRLKVYQNKQQKK